MTATSDSVQIWLKAWNELMPTMLKVMSPKHLWSKRFRTATSKYVNVVCSICYSYRYLPADAFLLRLRVKCQSMIIQFATLPSWCSAFPVLKTCQILGLDVISLSWVTSASACRNENTKRPSPLTFGARSHPTSQRSPEPPQGPR